ncbi:hypothetical protein QBC47DRAFT_356948 [Echria macrotheca]|uniref:Uncharacterized protein n=1 Tax=Echria macrotheca TaxID=438768 RepID=A0AAJ0BIT1_9PEZI|nr:hypothetical protein QBC47DRAFT_356948 [Echria macrotheca]
MHFLGVFFSTLAVLGANAAPTPAVESRDTTGVIRLCVDFDAGGACADVTIPSGAISTSSITEGFSAFEVDTGTLCTELGGCPSSAMIVTPGLTCDLSDSFSSFVGCGAIIGTGHEIEIDSTDGFVNFNGPLNDNLRCIQCHT